MTQQPSAWQLIGYLEVSLERILTADNLQTAREIALVALQRIHQDTGGFMVSILEPANLMLSRFTNIGPHNRIVAVEPHEDNPDLVWITTEQQGRVLTQKQQIYTLNTICKHDCTPYYDATRFVHPDWSDQ
jgi:hypothetical protein